MDYKQVEGRSDLFRDTDSGAIVNTDRSAFLAYKAKKQQDNQPEYEECLSCQ